MFQNKGERNTSSENFVVRGMNQKLNYYIDKNKMFDLEFGIPIRQVNVDQ